MPSVLSCLRTRWMPAFSLLMSVASIRLRNSRPRQTANGPVVAQEQWKVAQDAVTQSLASLFDAYAAMARLPRDVPPLVRARALQQEVTRLAAAPDFCRALKDLPIEVRNLCYSETQSCAVNEWLAATYRSEVLTLLGQPVTPMRTLPVAKGADWTSVCSSRTQASETKRLGVPVGPIEYK